jgi:hypothetical protein
MLLEERLEEQVLIIRTSTEGFFRMFPCDFQGGARI